MKLPSVPNYMLVINPMCDSARLDTIENFVPDTFILYTYGYSLFIGYSEILPGNPNNGSIFEFTDNFCIKILTLFHVYFFAFFLPIIVCLNPDFSDPLNTTYTLIRYELQHYSTDFISSGLVFWHMISHVMW